MTFTFTRTVMSPSMRRVFSRSTSGRGISLKLFSADVSFHTLRGYEGITQARSSLAIDGFRLGKLIVRQYDFPPLHLVIVLDAFGTANHLR